MIRFFKSIQPATLVIIPLIILVFWSRIFLNAMPVEETKSLPLWALVIRIFSVFPSWVNFLFLFALISAEAIYFNLMINRNEVHYKNSFLPAFIFALFISSTPALMQFHPVHLINFFLIMILGRLFTLFKNDFPVSALFDCGFLAGIASLIYFPTFVLIPFILTTLVVLRSFRIKEWLITIIGMILPYFFISIYMFWNHELIPFWKRYLSFFHNIRPQFLIASNLPLLILSISIVTLLLLSLLKLRTNYRKNIIRTRNYQQIFLILLIFGAGWLILCEKLELIHFTFLLIPASVFCSYYFVSAKKIWIYEYVLWAFIAVILWNHLS